MRAHFVIGASCAAVVIAGSVLGTSSQAADGKGSWAQWSSTTASPTTMTIGADGFAAPTATYTTDAESASRPTADFLNAKTPPGERFGSSQGERLLRMGLKDTDSDTPSRTVYTFPAATPVGHFAFVLGDIDVDEVTIAATAADGSKVSAKELGFRSTFNFCNGVDPFPLTCEDKTWTTEPNWQPDQMTLRGSTPGDETEGASGWFLPTVSLKSLTFTFAKLPLGGNPTYRTWFVGDDVPKPSPTRPSPSPSQSSTSPSSSPSPSQSSASPSPTTPSPTNSDRPPVPLKVVTSDTTLPNAGSTVVVRKIKTRGRVVQRTTCRPQGASAAGEVRLCAKTFNRSKGTITVRTFGREVTVKVTITSIPTGADRSRYSVHRQVFHFGTA